MSTAISHSRLPMELIEIIISDVWFLPLSTEDRITLMTSSFLVNRTWMNVFQRISSKHVYIPSRGYLYKYFTMLCGIFTVFGEHTQHPRLLCQSIRLTVEHAKPGIAGDVTTNPQDLTNLIQFLQRQLTPNLRTLSIEFLNATFDDIFESFYFDHIPTMVTNLELEWTFSSKNLEAMHTRNTRENEPIRWCVPSIRHVSILGGNETLIAVIVSGCPNMETLRMDLRLNNAYGGSTKIVKVTPDDEDVGYTSKISIAKSIAYERHPDPWQGILVHSEDRVCTFHRS